MASATRRADGSYCATIQVNGRRKYIYGKTPQEVKRKLEATKKQVAISNTLPTVNGKSVGDLLDFWLETVRHGLKPRTIADYQIISAEYIKPRIGGIKLNRLEPGHLQKLYADLQARGLKRAPYYAHQVLHRALHLAVLWGWLPSNPADRVLSPSYKPEHKSVWSVEELGTFLEGTRDHWVHPLFVTLAVTGCRIGEVLGLKWDDVQGSTITIKRTLHYINGQFVESTPKTRAGERTVVLPEDGVLALKRQRVQQSEWRLQAGDRWQHTGYMFTNREGRPLYQWHVQHTMAEVCRRLGLPKLTPHGLRHLHASLLLSRGLPLTDVSARLGHANPNITATVYAHVIPGRDAEAARVVESVLRGWCHMS